MKKVLFIDRDGVLLVEPPVTFQIDSLEKVRFVPGMVSALGKIARELAYELVMVSNQDGLGTGNYPEAIFQSIQTLLLDTLAGEGVYFTQIHIDRLKEEQVDWQLPHHQISRKPGTALLQGYLKGYDLASSFVIGDRLTDLQLATNLGCQSIWFQPAKTPVEGYSPALVADQWADIYHFLRNQDRLTEIIRKTAETEIRVRLRLDGHGISRIQTGLPFFDHMLDQLARHGGYDLEINCRGDLEIDEHHSIEDTALALGQAFREAIGKKTGIGRYGFCLPMDDCLAQVALDFGGRPWLVWGADFRREKVGEVPTELFFHFFKSFSDAAAINLNIKAEGDNEHHKIESIFKAFARALRMATDRRPGDNSLPSTKGSL